MVLLVLLASGLSAQTLYNRYTFGASTGTYTPLTGATQLFSTAAIGTDGISASVTIPSFTFNGTSYTSIVVSNNGFITFGATTPTATTYTPISSTTGYSGAVAGFATNLIASTVSGSAPTIGYQDLTGSSEFVIQFTDVARTTLATADRINFQIRLNYSTGAISVVYGSCVTTSTSTTSGFPQVGLRGSANSDYHSRSVNNTAGSSYNSTTWAASGGGGTADNVNNNASTCIYRNTYAPSSGLTWTWSAASYTYLALPFSQNFETATWSNRNAVQDVTSTTSMVTAPASGHQSWRRSSVTTANSAWATTTGGSFTLGTGQGTGSARFHTYNIPLGGIGCMDYYLDFSASSTDKILTFDYLNTTGTDVVQILLSTDGGATFSTIGAATGVAATWTATTRNLGSSNSSTVVLRFRGTSDYGLSDIGVDNISVTAPSCFVPTAVTVNSVSTSSVGFSFTAPSPAPGLGYEYVVSTLNTTPAGAGTFNAGTSVSVSSLTANTNYYIFVRSQCDATTFSSWTASTSFFTGYCVPAPSSVDGTGITNVTFSGVNNTTGAEPGNFGNFTSLTGGSIPASTMASVSITYSTGGATYITRIWVDWNNDLDFTDSGEEVYAGVSSTASPAVLAASFTVPALTSVGSYRMRIGGADLTTPTPCYSGTWASFEDYTLEVTAAPTCFVPTALSSSISVGSATISWTAPATGTAPASYNWEIRSSGAVGSGAGGLLASGVATAPTTSATVTSGLTLNTTYTYYVQSNCGGGDLSAWTSGNFLYGYCVPNSGDGCLYGDLIARVTLNTLDNNSGAACVAAYNDYTANPALTTALQAGGSYSCTVYTGAYGQNFTAWIDYNDNLTFETSERIGYTSTAVGANSNSSFPINLACNPPLGTHRLRVRSAWDDEIPVGSGITPCGTQGYGEVEDYVVTIITAVDCPAPTGLAASNATSTSVGLSWTTGCTETAWDIEYGPAGFTPGAGTIVSVTGTPATTLSGLTGGTLYDFYVNADCGVEDGLSAQFGPVQALTLPANDNCSDAIAISCASTTVSGTTVGSTVDASYINAGAGGTNTTERGVWYTIAGDDNEYTISTCASVGYDSRLSVYSGSCGSLVGVTGNDDDAACSFTFNFGKPSTVTFNAYSGTTYYVFVHGYQFGTALSAIGNFNLNITCNALCLPVPSNEDCASAAVLTGNTTCVNTSGNNECASASSVANPGAFNPFATLNDVWYSFTPDYPDNSLTITYGSATSLGFYFYTGACGSLTEGNGVSAVTSGNTYNYYGFTVGVPYYIRVLSTAANAGSFNICMTEAACAFPTASVATATSTTNVEVVITGAAGNYIIEYGAPGFTPGTAGTAGVGGTIVNTSTLTTSVAVAADSNYDFYVRKNCSSTSEGYSFNQYAGSVTTYNVVPFTGTASITTCSATIYDHAVTGNYSNNAFGSLTIYPGNPSGILTLSGTFSTETNWDFVTFYEGEDTGGTLLADYTGVGTISVVASAPNTPITVVFESDGSGVGSGFQMTASCQEVCTDVPGSAALTGNASVCPNETVNISLTTAEIGLTYIWQRRVAPFGTWIAIPGETGPTLNVTQTQETQYRARVGCVYFPNGGATNPTQVWTVTMNSFNDCYCQPTASDNTGGDFLAAVVCGGINNVSGANASAYTNYTAAPGFTTSFLTNGQYSITSTTGTWGFSNYLAAWIDYNQNGEFELSEKISQSGSLAGSTPFTSNFTIPSTALAGTTRLRVREVFGATTTNPCTGSFGETEDYTVTIAPGSSNDVAANATLVSPPIYPACLNLSGNLALATDDPSDASTGVDLWYSFVAASNACRIAVSGGTVTNVEVELQNSSASNATTIVTENAQSANGSEIMITDDLAVGTQYWVAIRNAGGVAGTFNVCIQTLSPSGCDNGPNFGSICSGFKADWTGTGSYTATFTSVSNPLNVYTHTTNGANTWIPLTTVVGNVGNPTPGGLQYGQSYSAVVASNFTLPNANGASQTAIAVSSAPSCTISIAPVAALNMASAYASTASGSLSIPGTNPRASGSWIVTDLFICGAIGYSWSISEVNYLDGTVQAIPFIATTVSRQIRLTTANIPNLAAGKRYQVLVAPIFAWGTGAYNTASQRYVQIAGSAGMVEENNNEEVVLVDKSLTTGVFASLYPNPNNGENVNINIAGIESESVNIRIMDASGRTVWSNNFFVEGLLATTVSFDRPLAAGIYMVEMNYNGEISTQRMVVQK
jgi:hypothetical protein